MSFTHSAGVSESNLLSWQKDLISQIIFALNSYYSDPNHLDDARSRLITSLVEAFEKRNQEFKDVNQAPSTETEYQSFLEIINPLLEKFDSHMHLQYLPQFIAEVKQHNQVVKMGSAASPKFDLGDQPPDKELLEWSQAQVDPRNHFGFVADPNICSLHIIDSAALGKQFHHTPTYVLANDGLYFIEHSNQKISAEHLIISNHDSNHDNKYVQLCDKLPPNKNEYGLLLTPEQQKAITDVTGHVFPKRTVPENVGYLKVNYLVEPHFGEHKSPEYQLGPKAVNALNAIMKSFENKDAIILDLRNAPQGGSPAMAHYLISFFVAQKGLLIDEIHDRRHEKTDKFLVKETPSQLFSQPVVILVDETTFSAREAIAFHMQKLNTQLQQEFKEGDRFQVIGTQTKGGAHPTYSFPLASTSGEIHSDLIVWLPCSASTKKDWEGVGVTPDVKIKANEDALKVAVTKLSEASSALENQPSVYSEKGVKK